MLKTPSMIGYWNLDDNLNDLSGVGNTLIALRDITEVTGKFGKGRFSQGYTVTTSSLYNYNVFPTTDSITFACWMKIPSYSSTLGYGHIIFSNSPEPKMATILMVNGTTHVLYGCAFRLSATNTADYGIGTTALSLDTWYHVAMTASNGGTLTAYLNGEIEFTFACGTKSITGVFTLGDLRPGRGWSQGDMYFDSPVIYNKILSQSDIKRLMLGLHPING